MSDDIQDIPVKVPKIRVHLGDKVIEFPEDISAQIFLVAALTGKTPTQIVEESIEGLYKKHMEQKNESDTSEKIDTDK